MEAVEPNIILNEYESKLFKKLLEIVKEKNLGTTLRVAGGWVRDKVAFYTKVGNGS